MTKKELITEIRKYRCSDLSDALDALGLQMLEQREIGKAQHVFTHIIWHMQGIYARVQNAPAPEDYEWVPKEEIETKALPTALSVFTRWGRKNLWNQ